MALYAQGCETLRAVLVSAATAARGAPWQQVVLTTVNAYLSAIESMPAVTRTLLVEVQAAGPRAYRLRQQTQARFAGTIVGLVDAGRTMDPSAGPAPLSPGWARSRDRTPDRVARDWRSAARLGAAGREGR